MCLPVFNCALAFDIKNQEALFYEAYLGSINVVFQLQYLIEKAKGYSYRRIGFILYRGYFSKGNIEWIESNDYSFFIMVKRKL
jgi:hypothetical protein